MSIVAFLARIGVPVPWTVVTTWSRRAAREPIMHDVKCWPEPFDARAAGLKPWELRLNDRDYRVGDTLRQRRWCPDMRDYTGEVHEHRITWALFGPAFGLRRGYVVMTLDSSSSDLNDADYGGRPDFTVTFGGPSISKDMEFLQRKLGRGPVGVVRHCVSCMAGQLGADLPNQREIGR